MPEKTTALAIKNICKNFGTVCAVKDMNLDIGDGEFVSLLGPSGCGKTTLLRIIAGFETPDRGEVLLDGKNIVIMPPNKRPMNMVFQRYALFPHMTIYENIAFSQFLKKRPKDEIGGKVREMLALVQLEGFESRKPDQLSGGQCQRIALARALINQPRVLLLDEPLGALDLKIRKQMQIELKKIQDKLKITFLYVTHDQEEALSISDRIAVMSAGRIEQIGTAPEIYGAPATPFVAEFVGTMNRLQTQVLDGGQGEVDWNGVRLRVNAARGRSRGDRVLVLIRPEAVEVEPLPDRAEHQGVAGRVASKSFLGAITRLKIATDTGGELTADVQSARTGVFPVGAGVQVRIAPEASSVLTLPPG